MQKRKSGRGVPITWEGDPEHRWVTQWSGFDQENGLLHSPKGGVGAAWGHWAGTMARG